MNAYGKATQYFALCKTDVPGKKYLRQVLCMWGVNVQ